MLEEEQAAVACRIEGGVVSECEHEPKMLDEKTRTIEFHVGTTAWSWGYNMQLHIEPTASGESIVTTQIMKSGGSAVSWGSGKKEVKKIYDGIEAQLKKKVRARVEVKD